MKKLMLFILAAVMAVGMGGTALAATTVEFNVDGGVSNVYWGPSFGTATGGASLYVLSGTIFDITATGNNESATTLYGISNTLTNADGTELLQQQLMTSGNFADISGSTPIGGPQLVSGTSDTVIVYVRASSLDTVGSQPESGNTLYAINGGTGAVYWAKAIPCTGFAPTSDLSVFDGANTGATFHCTAPVTIDTSSYISDTLGGATIFGVSGATWTGSALIGSGVSVWAIDADTGAYTTSSAGLTNVTGFPFIGGSAGSGVSVVHAAPVVSGSSLFIIGYGADGGNTIYGLLKDNLQGGVTEALINGSGAADLSDQWMPTPCVTGGSIFVVDNDGGVTSFYTQNLTQNYASQLIFGEELTTGVTAGPVTDGTYIVFSGTTRIRCAKVDNVSTGVSKEWEYSFGASKSIWATPAIVGQSGTTYVFVSVNDTGANTARTYRFTLTDTYQGAPTIVRAHGKLVYASPIVVEDDLWTVSYNPAVDKLENIGVSGLTYWPQFKFDAAKTGANLYTPSAAAAAAAAAAYTPGSSGGCFISTIK